MVDRPRCGSRETEKFPLFSGATSQPHSKR
ncbi:hypothetical protein V6Z12_D04G026900 [Gossypium hirsutum]